MANLSIGDILSDALDDKIQNQNDSFIYKTIQLLLIKKTQIEINISELNKASSIPEKSCVFFGDVVKRNNPKHDKYVIPKDNTNIFRFDYFNNLETWVINGVQQVHNY